MAAQLDTHDRSRQLQHSCPSCGVGVLQSRTTSIYVLPSSGHRGSRYACRAALLIVTLLDRSLLDGMRGRQCKRQPYPSAAVVALHCSLCSVCVGEEKLERKKERKRDTYVHTTTTHTPRGMQTRIVTTIRAYAVLRTVPAYRGAPGPGQVGAHGRMGRRPMSCRLLVSPSDNFPFSFDERT